MPRFTNVEEHTKLDSPTASPSRELAKQRVFLFLFGITSILFTYFSIAEGDLLVTSFDDILTACLGFVGTAIALFSIWRENDGLGELKRSNNLSFILGLWLVAFSIFALEIEWGFPYDLADDIPKLVLAVSIVVNRWLR